MARERQAEEVPDDNTYLVCPLSDDVVEAVRAGAYKFREQNFPQEYKKARQSTNDVSSELKERRRLREAGEFVPDSGVSCVDDLKEFREFSEAYNDPLLYTQFVRREFYWQLNKEEMQRAVARYYGWDKWSEDPWGSYLKFCEWIVSARDNEMAVWAVNETSKGREYLVHSILEGLVQLDYSEMTEKDLLTQTGYGAASFLHVKRYTGWDDFGSHYPKEPLPARLVNEWVSKVYPFDFKLPCSGDGLIVATKADGSLDIPKRVPDPEEMIDFFSLFIDARNYGPLTRYRFLVSSIYLWYIALDEAREKAKGHPVLGAFLNYHAATDTQMAELCRKLAPKDYQLPDKNQALTRLHEAMKVRLKVKEGKYDDVFEKGIALTWEGLLEGVNYWKPKAYEATITGLKGQLGNSLMHIVENYFIDKRRQADPQFRDLWQKAQAVKKPKTPEERRKLLDMVKNLRDKIQWKEPLNPSDKELFNSLQEELISAITSLSLDREIKDKDGSSYYLGDMIADDKAQRFVETIDEGIDLKSLGLDLDKLPPKERWVMQDVYQALQEGCNFDSKLGGSFRQRWGEDYDKNIRAYNRGKRKLKQP